MILHVVGVEVVGPYVLSLTFDDGTTKIADVRPILEGPVFEPLHDTDFFARVVADPTCGTIVWPNGADFAPEALHELADLKEAVAAFPSEALDSGPGLGG